MSYEVNTDPRGSLWWHAFIPPFCLIGHFKNNLDSETVDILSEMAEEIQLQAYLGDIVGSFPEHRNNMSIAIKRVIIFLLVESLALNL